MRAIMQKVSPGSLSSSFCHCLPLTDFLLALQAVDVLRKQVIDMVLATDMKQV